VKSLAIIQKSTQKATDRKRNLIAYSTPNSSIAEQYRIISANIHLTCSSLNFRTILITSPSGGEGKSTTATNLSVAMAQQGGRILLVDTNLKSPTVHTTFKIQNDIGLTSILNGMASMEEAIHKTEIGRLDVLPSGPVPFFSSELFTSESLMKFFIRSLEVYDYILIDSTSVLDVADTKILANQCDGVVLVINPGKSKLEKLKEAKRVLEFTDTQIVGVILNEK
jgi:capsular exopolysaccharide synthesis family protein